MATINSFEDIEAWQLARKLDNEVYLKSCELPFYKDFTLKDQILRASGSIMDNIAEGFGRGGSKEFIHFLSISKGSCTEVQSQLYRALDRNYINQTEFDNLKQQTKFIEGKISAFISYLNKTEIRGIKFKKG